MKGNRSLLMLGLVLFSLVLLLNANETPQDDKKTDEAATDQFGGEWGGPGGGPGGGYGYGGPGWGYGGYGGYGRGWGRRCRWGCCGGRWGGGGYGGGGYGYGGGGGCRYCCRSAQEARAYNMMMPDTTTASTDQEANP